VTQRIVYKATCPGCEGSGKIAVSSGEPPCPFCSYEDASGKTHDPLSTVRDRNIHRETHPWCDAKLLRAITIAVRDRDRLREALKLIAAQHARARVREHARMDQRIIEHEEALRAEGAAAERARCLRIAIDAREAAKPAANDHDRGWYNCANLTVIRIQGGMVIEDDD